MNSSSFNNGFVIYVLLEIHTFQLLKWEFLLVLVLYHSK